MVHGQKGNQPDKAQGAQGVVTMLGICVPRGTWRTCGTSGIVLLSIQCGVYRLVSKSGLHIHFKRTLSSPLKT